MVVYYQKKTNISVHTIIVIVALSIILFLLIALLSYHPDDFCSFYVSTKQYPLHNVAGRFGAECSAFLYYYFGGAAFFFPVLLFFITTIFIIKKNFISDWERVIAVIVMMPAIALFLATYSIDFPWIYSPGGLVGLVVYQWLLVTLCPAIILLFLLITVGICFIILTRFCYMGLVCYCIKIVNSIVITVHHYRIVQHSVTIIKLSLYYTIIWPICVVKSLIFSLLDGSAFDGTDLVVPEDNNQAETVFSNNNDINTVDNNTSGDGLAVDYSSYSENGNKNNKVAKAKITVEFNDKNIHNSLSNSVYSLPDKTIFMYDKSIHQSTDMHDELTEQANVLQDKLKRFGVSGQVVAIKRGPVVTLFEYKPAVDTKLSKIISLEDDLAMALQAMSVRILAPIPGKSVVGFEVANNHRHNVLFSELVTSSAYKNFSGWLPIVLGKGTIGDTVIVDLARMPHLLIAGSTGSGKSVALNVLLISLLCKLNPDELKLILIDPKRLEFAAFADIAHLLFPIVTSPHYAPPILRWVVNEMESRYEKMALKGVRNCAEYNRSVMQEGNGLLLPAIVVVIDELADLMLTVGRDIEELITRITQMARAAGIHMIVATQRPSVDVITGLIKANFPSRISFRVASRIDSRTILDSMGADRLLGSGDMLFLDASASGIKRVHGAYVSDNEIMSVVNHIKSQRTVHYLDIKQEMKNVSSEHNDNDLLYDDIKSFLDEVDEVSISLIQRKFRIGYNRSARIIDALQADGLIMPQDSGKMRKVIR